MINVTDAADVADRRGAPRYFDQLIKARKVGHLPAVDRAGWATDVGSCDAIASRLKFIGDMGSNETGGTGDNYLIHGDGKELLWDKYFSVVGRQGQSPFAHLHPHVCRNLPTPPLVLRPRDQHAPNEPPIRDVVQQAMLQVLVSPAVAARLPPA